MNKAVISVLGKDRPGIIAAVTKILFDLACNIENVSQTILQTEFSGIFIASLPADISLATLDQHLKQGLDPMGLHVFVKPMEPDLPVECVPCEPFVITTRGPDRKGLVARITEIIAKYGANVTNLQAVFKGGSDPDSNIMIYQVDIPDKIDQRALRNELRQKAAELALEISIQHQKVFEAINRI